VTRWIVDLKQSEPNALRRELARSQQAGPHPDANLLTAFGEGSLSKRERDLLIEHLAVCTECRDLVSIVASSAPETARDEVARVLPFPTRPPLRTWLPWVAAAAGVMVVGSSILLYEQKKELRDHSENNSNLVAKVAVQDRALSDKQLQTVTPEESKAVSAKTKPYLPSKATPAAKTPVVTATYADKETVNTSTAAQPSPAPIGGPAAARNSQAPVVNRAPSAPPALSFSEASQVVAQPQALHRTARPQWRINAMGQAERSYEPGTWQAVLPDEKMRVVSVFGDEVWIGSERQRLYHSSDNGTTWNSVVLSQKNGNDRTITHIRFQTLEIGTAEAEDGTSWTTVDGGKTWK